MLARSALFAVSLFAPLAVGFQPVVAQSYDLLIQNGRIIDGTGSPSFNADVGVLDGVIVAVGDLSDATADRVIDASGHVVSPGFIDMHSHADRALYAGNAQLRSAPNLVAQGITTLVFGPDGRNPAWPLRDEIAGYESGGVGPNVVPMVGHGTVRGQVMGADYEREATEEEIAAMAAEVRQGMEEGAWGLASSPPEGRFLVMPTVISSTPSRMSR